MRFSLLLFLSLLATRNPAQIGPMANKGATRAVIVGISEYEDQRIPRLFFAHRDAQAMADFLLSDAGGSVSPDNIKLLANEKATRGEITTAFYWLVGESKPGDRAVIYFSGHGDMENKIMMDQGYLLAHDAKASNYMGSGTLPVDMLQKVIQTLSLKLDVEVILITDACRAGKLAGSESGGVIATNQGLAQQFANEIKILSCEPDQASLESEDWGGGRGLFSYFLIDGLKGLADRNQDLKIELREISRFLEDEVSSRAEQYPMTIGSGGAELFKVYEDTLLAVQERKLMAREAIASANARGAMPGDTVVHPLFRKFQQAMAAGHLLYPEEGSAYQLFQQMQPVEALQHLISAQRLNLAAALQDDAQQAINAYLETSPEEMARRWRYDKSYRHYPEYLDKAAELVGAGNFLYEDLKARQAYFEGLAFRLRAETLPDKDSILQLAIQKQELALGMDSLAPHVYNELGLVHLRLKDYQQALQYFERANTLSPSWVIPIANISTAQLMLARYDEAAATAEQALALREDYAPPRCNLADIACKQGDYQRAAELAQAAIGFDSLFTNAWFILGIAREGMNMPAQAKEAYRKAYEINPEDALVNNKLGYLAQVSEQFGEAVDYYQAAIQYHPYFANAHYNLGFIYLSGLPDYPKSEEHFRQYAKLKPADMEGLVLLACALSRQGNQEEALQWLEQALEGGFDAFDDLRSTPFLEGLQSGPRFEELLNRFEK
ncbi:MAG: tetratricopeptide repeat protein [Phaeodactylibacter sp.]|nr:tetratricopeptide repeat protein [Phaeodactylibacter sp.]